MVSEKAQRCADPLTDEELKTLLDYVGGMRSRFAHPVEIVPFTGLTQKEYTHLRESYITWNDLVTIDIPATMPCTSIRLEKGASFGVTDRKQPCRPARQDSAPEGRVNAKKARTIHVTETRAQDALREMFALWDENPATTIHLTERLQPECPVEFDWRRLKTTRLRLLAERGAEPEHIAAEWGINSAETVTELPQNARAIVRKYGDCYKPERNKARDLLALINDVEPVKTTDLWREYGFGTEASVRGLLDTLEKEGTIKTKKHTDKPYNPIHIESTATVEEATTCDVCDDTFQTMKGLIQHRQQSHTED